MLTDTERLKSDLVGLAAATRVEVGQWFHTNHRILGDDAWWRRLTSQHDGLAQVNIDTARKAWIDRMMGQGMAIMTHFIHDVIRSDWF